MALTLETYTREHHDPKLILRHGDAVDNHRKRRYHELCECRDATMAQCDRELKDGTRSLPADAATKMEELLDEIDELAKLPQGRISDPCSLPGDRPRASGPTFKTGDGQQVQALSFKDKFASLHSGGNSYSYHEPPNIGNVLTALATGRTDFLTDAERLSVIGNSGTSGGYLLNPELSANVIDLARAASVCMRAGAFTVPMSTSELVLAKITSDATSYWRPEGTAVTASQPAFGRLTLKAKTLACLVPCSIELLEDSPNAGQVITGAIQAAMAAEIDRVIIQGDGAASEPLGIRSTTGVNTNTGIGAIADYSDVTKAVMEILADNYPGEISGLAWLQHPVIAADYDALVSATEGQPLIGTPWSLALQRFYSTNLPALEGGGSNEYTDIIGDFSQVVVGMRTSGVVVEVLNSGSGTDADSVTVNATSDLMRWIRCYVRLDVGVLQPAFFCINSGITT